jgi:hypothetical protein
MAAVSRPASDAELAAVRAVLDGMSPGRRWPRWWFAEALVINVFPAVFYAAIQERPERVQALWVHVRDDGGIRLTYGPDPLPEGPWRMIRQGYRPREKGHAKLAEAARQWFQAYCLDVPKPTLTQNYASRENRVTPAHSVLNDRLEAVETLLNRIVEGEGGL